MNLDRVRQHATRLGYTVTECGNGMWLSDSVSAHRLAWVTVRDSGGKGVLKFTSHNPPDELQQLLEETE